MAGLVKIPDGIPLEQAAFIEPVNTCYKAIQLLNLQPDETALVIGQGPIAFCWPRSHEGPVRQY